MTYRIMPGDNPGIGPDEDPIERQFPSTALCPICKVSRKVLQYQDDIVAGERVAELEVHTVTESLLDDSQRYACTIEVRCVGSGAKVSKWKRIGRRSK